VGEEEAPRALSGQGEAPDPLRVVHDYHERTKHRFDRFAAALGYLDWKSQPDPFRRFAGSALHELPLPQLRDTPYANLFRPGSIPPAPLDLGSLSRLLRLSLSLTAWKEIRASRWALRANPSSGNLHPTEGYLVLPAVAGLAGGPGVWHYAPREHGLERRADLDWSGPILVGLSSIPWREAWKYGERAFRYCQHDLGHAIGSFAFAAAALGWHARLLDTAADDDIGHVLGLDRSDEFDPAEREIAEALLVLTADQAGRGPEGDAGLLSGLTAARANLRFHGRANRLSQGEVQDWPILDEIAAATRRPPGDVATGDDFSGFPGETALEGGPVAASRLSAERAILGRRSAVAMDGVSAIPASVFYRMLDRTLPGRANRGFPFAVLPWRPRIHLGLFVHRVAGIEPGLYALARDPAEVEVLRSAMHPGFLWSRPPARPDHLPLFLLEAMDCRGLAARVSCDQEIAGDGAFAVAMIADFAAPLAEAGPWVYRRLFWEAGLIGQALYLEAEEAGIRATGIGCYYDDPSHEVFGLAGRARQILYHFTAGGPVEDRRLTTSLPYERR
jgi:nitroreductase